MKNPDAYNKLKLNKYFSNDAFDRLYLDSSLYPQNNKKTYTEYKKK